MKMSVSAAALLLAGFVLAHAGWNVSDLEEGDLLCPLAVVEEHGQRTLDRFEAKTQEEAIAKGKAAMVEHSKTADAWAFAREGLLTEETGKTDILVVDFWAKGMAKPVT